MVRKATVHDADAIVELIMLAMGDLPYKFVATKDKVIATALLKRFVTQTGNQYSLSNIFVDEQDQKVVGAINAYDGGEIERLRKPFFDYICKNFHKGGFEMELESESGEFYIDTVAVDPRHQGKGIGKNLILEIINYAKDLGFKKVGLLVSNPDAKRLYEKIGFTKVGSRNLLGNTHEHLVYHIN
ncbi:GNAT family N-acetyltransferase [Pedobacter polaris]|uniref:GNAT family N-acetyltransferase n=1 Tax=Pedobacter polaris TaxID=2571273 RepID=A0A4U1CH39_9SPHI|nr:GNAT family N-acetyltransferase [Pedobacter polaris]TKC06615.1 GNAT family N-acetyltransferase [Pedobacter polaris]